MNDKHCYVVEKVLLTSRMTLLLPPNLTPSHSSWQFGLFCYAVQSFTSQIISQVPLCSSDVLIMKHLSKAAYFSTLTLTHTHTHTHAYTHTHMYTHAHTHNTHTHTHTHSHTQQQDLFSSQTVQSWAASTRREMLQHAENCFHLALGLEGTKHAEPWLYCLMLGKTRYKLGQPAANTLQHLLKVIVL